MQDRLSFYWNRLRERLWFKPLLVSALSVGGAFIAKTLDLSGIEDLLPTISAATNQKLLEIMASSMLVIATFAVASMVSAYSSASNTATPRSFPLVVADDASQAALSSFIGAFIYSIVALVALTNEYYSETGHFLVFLITMAVFAWVVLTFVRWVDRIARLGRMNNVIDKVEDAAMSALERRRRQPTLHGAELDDKDPGFPIYAETIGYVQRVDIEKLQEIAENGDCHITLAALPGTFSSPGRVLAYIRNHHNEAGKGNADEDGADENNNAVDSRGVLDAFRIGDVRIYDEDPRFGLIVLSEIAARALSPAVNDPGSAIQIIGVFVRLFARWVDPLESDNDEDEQTCRYDRVHVPRLCVDDMFNDAFAPIARDGAGNVEVQTRLQKAFAALYFLEVDAMQDAARKHSAMALERASQALVLDEERETVRAASGPIRTDS